ncbi:SDR family NAD(P)-dependent oxidoreductase [Flavobacteriaceae bacterium]|nr:SDR family NAD(P)-dependent oxidoreductase [Flavobacteriaceae bacterium]
MTKFSLHNKGLVLTGGGSGIGEAIALTFARQGATVYILDFNIEAAEETVKQIELEGFSAKAYACDISKQNEVNECIDKIAKLNSIDILINNAGIAHVGNIEAVEEVKYGLGNVSVGDYQPVYDNEEVCKYVSKHIGKDVDYDIVFKS